MKVDSVPSYIQSNARRGLDLLEFAGDGLTDKTKREARSMANGQVSDNKAVRMAAWFARHISDLDSPNADAYLRGDRDRPTAGQVAWLLWGGDLGKSNRLRAMKWAERQSNDDEKQVSNAVETGLRRKAEEHNEKVGNAKTKRTTLRTLIAVFERGIGAYETNPQSVRPTVTSAEQWAYARVNSFLYALRNGKFRSGKHDTDLLPKGHPQSSKSASMSAQVIEIDNSGTSTIDSAITQVIKGIKPYHDGEGDDSEDMQDGLIENLYTEGGELVLTRTGEEYVGYYHIHPEGGPMVGARHTDQPHAYLTYIKYHEDEKPYHHDEEDEDEDEKIELYRRSFIKNCSIMDDDECEHTKIFKASLPIEKELLEPIYKGDRIVDYKNVIFKGYGSTNETITEGDRIGDYLRRGAFKETIKEFRKNPVMLIDHENSVHNIAGSYTRVEEDKNGLYLEGKISDAPHLANVRMLVAEGHLQTLSIGGMFYYEDDGKAISKVDLMEVSLVAIPMNPDARFRPMGV